MPGLPKAAPSGAAPGSAGGVGRPDAVDSSGASGAVEGSAEGGGLRERLVAARRRGPRHPGQRQARVNLRVSEDDARALEAAARLTGLTVSGYVAAAALAAAAGQPAPRPRVGAREVVTREALLAVNQARAQLRHVGGNLNQLAKAANTTGELPPNLSQVLEEVHAAVAEVDAATVRLTRRRPE